MVIQIKLSVLDYYKVDIIIISFNVTCTRHCIASKLLILLLSNTHSFTDPFHSIAANIVKNRHSTHININQHTVYIMSKHTCVQRSLSMFARFFPMQVFPFFLLGYGCVVDLSVVQLNNRKINIKWLIDWLYVANCSYIIRTKYYMKMETYNAMFNIKGMNLNFGV